MMGTKGCVVSGVAGHWKRAASAVGKFVIDIATGGSLCVLSRFKIWGLLSARFFLLWVMGEIESSLGSWHIRDKNREARSAWPWSDEAIYVAYEESESAQVSSLASHTGDANDCGRSLFGGLDIGNFFLEYDGLNYCTVL